MTQLTLAVTPALSVTFAVYEKFPALVGVPVIAPVDAFSVSPVGRLPAVIE